MFQLGTGAHSSDADSPLAADLSASGAADLVHKLLVGAVNLF